MEYLATIFFNLVSDIGLFEDLGNNQFKDVFIVLWGRSIDKDLGDAKGIGLPEPELNGYTL